MFLAATSIWLFKHKQSIFVWSIMGITFLNSIKLMCPSGFDQSDSTGNAEIWYTDQNQIEIIANVTLRDVIIQGK